MYSLGLRFVTSGFVVILLVLSSLFIPPVGARQPVQQAATADPTSQSASRLMEFVWFTDGKRYVLRFGSQLAVYGKGNVYVFDNLNDSNQKFDQDGEFLTMCGGSGSGDGQFLFHCVGSCPPICPPVPNWGVDRCPHLPGGA